MELRYADKSLKKFVTNVGLITSEGPYGSDVMACEFTYKISSDPGLMAIGVHPENATAENIEKTREFGISIAASDQNVLSSIAGNTSAKEHDKIAILKELGFKFYKAKTINALMVEGAAINLECRVVNEYKDGDHILFIGEVLDKQDHPEKEVLVYHKGRYWLLNTNVPKPSDEDLKRMDAVMQKYRKQAH